MSDETTLNDVCTPKKFVEENPHVFEGPGAPSMEYLLRTRKSNGLSDCGAVIEPVQRRFLIVKPKFLQWFLTRDAA